MNEHLAAFFVGLMLFGGGFIFYFSLTPIMHNGILKGENFTLVNEGKKWKNKGVKHEQYSKE